MPAVTVNFASQEALLRDLDRRLAAGRGFAVATLNLDHAVKLHRNPGFHAAYLQQTHIVADGNPIVWLQRLAGRRVDLVPGSDLIAPLVAVAAAQDVPVALFGATEVTLDRAAERLLAANPGLRIVARIAPGFGFDPAGEEADHMIAQIAASGARLCLLALGAPKQEVFAARAFEAMPGCGFVSIGAGLDFIAGTQKRAPRWVRRIAMEWAWRLANSPRRLARRYADSALILPFLAAAALQSRIRGPEPAVVASGWVTPRGSTVR